MTPSQGQRKEHSPWCQADPSSGLGRRGPLSVMCSWERRLAFRVSVSPFITTSLHHLGQCAPGTQLGALFPPPLLVTQVAPSHSRQTQTPRKCKTLNSAAS